MKTAGVLGLQGDFEAHQRALERAGARGVVVRTAADLDGVAGLVIPGGESTTMLKLLKEEKLWDPLIRFAAERPIFGTCAGAILLASRVTHPEQEAMAAMDLEIERNAYGRQIDSRVVSLAPEADFLDRTGPGEFEAVFIRAPKIRRAGPHVKVLVRYQGYPVLVEQDRHLAATFHPELTRDDRVHQLFISKL